MSYFPGRFQAAVHVLVREGPIKQRLIHAYTEYLENLDDQEVPPSIKSEMEKLHVALHSVAPAGKESPVRASVQKMSFNEAARYADAVVEIYAELLRHGDRLEPLKIVESTPSAPPRYLTNNS